MHIIAMHTLPALQCHTFCSNAADCTLNFSLYLDTVTDPKYTELETLRLCGRSNVPSSSLDWLVGMRQLQHLNLCSSVLTELPHGCIPAVAAEDAKYVQYFTS